MDYFQNILNQHLEGTAIQARELSSLVMISVQGVLEKTSSALRIKRSVLEKLKASLKFSRYLYESCFLKTLQLKISKNYSSTNHLLTLRFEG